MEPSNKELVHKTQTILKEFGYTVKKTHLHEMFARIAGYKNIHEATRSQKVREEPKPANELPFITFEDLPLEVQSPLQPELYPITVSDSSPSFGSEWRTVGKHRVELSCRCGYPEWRYWEVAKEIAEELQKRPEFNSARLVHIFADESNGSNEYAVVTDDEKTVEPLKAYLDEDVIRDDGQSFVRVYFVEPHPRKFSENYDHDKYLYQRWK
jgi:hypothetical protein